MTGPKPIVQLPHIQQGNLLTDASQAIGNFVTGLHGEQDRDRAWALEQALAQARMVQAQRGNPPAHIQIRDAQGLPQWAMVDSQGNVTPTKMGEQGQPAGAPESNYTFQTQTPNGNLGLGTVPRHANPGTPATNVPMPPGVEPKDFRPTPMQIETPGGPQIVAVNPRKGTSTAIAGPGGGDIQPRAQSTETRKASDAFDMIQGVRGMKQSIQIDPKAAQDVAAYIAAQGITEDIPLVGHAIQDVIEHARNALSPAASQYFQAFMQFAAARAFARGGATLTRNEIDYALAALAPRIGDPANVTQQREEFTRGVIQETIMGSGSAWQRYKDLAKQYGWEDVAGPMPPPPQGSMQINPRFRGRTP